MKRRIDVLTPDFPPVSKMSHKVKFFEEFNRFKFKVFLLLDWLPNQG